MSFSIISVPAPVSVPLQTYNAFLANTNNPALEGQNIRMCMLDTSTTTLSNRIVQSSVGQVKLVENVTQIALTTAVPTIISLVGSSLDSASINFDMPANGRLRYIGIDPTRININCKINLYGTVNNQQCKIVLYRNGVATNNSATIYFSNGLLTAQSCSLSGIFSVVTNDYFELSVQNNTNNNPVIIYNMSISGNCSFM